MTGGETPIQFLQGKVALVTGGARGIGAACCMHLARVGAAIMINDTGVEVDGSDPDHAVASRMARELMLSGYVAEHSSVSATTSEAAAELVHQTCSTLGRVDILVHAAGITRPGVIPDLLPSDWDMVMRVHLHAAFYLLHHSARVMCEQGNGGHVVLMSSGAAAGAPGYANYSAAKAGMLGLVYSAAEDLADNGIMVNAVWPGAHTRMNIRLDEVVANVSAVAHVVSRLVHPDTVITGECISVKGRSIHYVSRPKVMAPAGGVFLGQNGDPSKS